MDQKSRNESSQKCCNMQDFWFYLHDFDFDSFSVQIHKMDDTSIGR